MIDHEESYGRGKVKEDIYARYNEKDGKINIPHEDNGEVNNRR